MAAIFFRGAGGSTQFRTAPFWDTNGEIFIDRVSAESK